MWRPKRGDWANVRMMPILLDGHAIVTDNQLREPGDTLDRASLGSSKGDAGMSDTLKLLLDGVRGYEMTPDEIREQAISFAYGNGHIEDARITRDEIARAVDAVYAENEPRPEK